MQTPTTPADTEESYIAESPAVAAAQKQTSEALRMLVEEVSSSVGAAIGYATDLSATGGMSEEDIVAGLEDLRATLDRALANVASATLAAGLGVTLSAQRTESGSN